MEISLSALLTDAYELLDEAHDEICDFFEDIEDEVKARRAKRLKAKLADLELEP